MLKPIRCQWIYEEKKSGVNGKVDNFKARLVAHGLSMHIMHTCNLTIKLNPMGYDIKFIGYDMHM